jgi:hypothetical protein
MKMALVLLHQLLQLLDVVGLHALVLVPPPVSGRLGDLQVPGDHFDGLTLAEELLALVHLSDDLPGDVLPLLHGCAVLLPQNMGSGFARRMDQFTGSRSGGPNDPESTDRPWGISVILVEAPECVHTRILSHSFDAELLLN